MYLFIKSNWIIISLFVLTIAGLFIWVYFESTKQNVGQKFDAEGRDHVEIGTQVDYKTNPPTSGPHYVEWTKAGVFQTPLDDRNMVHSLEHGYVILSYNCDNLGERNTNLESTSGATLSENFNSNECQTLINQLTSVFDKKGKRKLIVVARVNLDSQIALTAWTYMDKLDSFDEERIGKFIDAHRDQGPERTME